MQNTAVVAVAASRPASEVSQVSDATNPLPGARRKNECEVGDTVLITGVSVPSADTSVGGFSKIVERAVKL
jgi:ribosomal protein S17